MNKQPFLAQMQNIFTYTQNYLTPFQETGIGASIVIGSFLTG